MGGGGCSKGPQEKGPLEYPSLETDPSQTGNLHHDRFEDKYFEQLNPKS